MNANDIKAAFLESGVALSGEEAEKLLIMCLDMQTLVPHYSIETIMAVAKNEAKTFKSLDESQT